MKIKVKGVHIGMLISTSMRDRDAGRRFLESLIAVAPDYAPEKYNDHEPVNLVFDRDRLDDALKCWGMTFLWRRRQPAIRGSALVGFRDTHDKVNVRHSLRAVDIPNLIRLFDEVAAGFGIDLGYVHVTTDADLTDIELYKQRIMPFQSLTTHDLREGIPDFAWAMVLGPPYVEMFGMEHLMNTPAALVQRLSPESVYIQLTLDPADVATARTRYLAAQEAAKMHLDHDAFRGQSKKCNIPRFLLTTN